MFNGIIENLLAQFPEIDNIIDRIFNKEDCYGETEEESAAIGYNVLRRLENTDQIFDLGWTYRQTGKNRESIEAIKEIFMEPFYEYVDEKLDDQQAMLTLLRRYKHRCEWFHRKRLGDLIQDQRAAEKLLALDLYSYLYDQGIDFSIEPCSITGEIDLISAQNTKDPLLADTKIFDGDSRGKTYIRKGVNQIYTYCQQYNEPFGYLIIYKITEKDLCFSLKFSRNIPLIIHNHKTIFLITIDIYSHNKPVSQRPPIKAIEITEEELIGIIEDETKEV